MPKTNPEKQQTLLEDDVIAEIRRRLVQIHVALASATDDDREIRRSTLHRVMDLLNDISPREPGPRRDAQPAHRTPGSGS